MEILNKKKYAEVAVGLPVDKTFYYSIPESLKGVQVGSLVLVPFSGRKLTGYVVGLKAEVDLEGIKNIHSLVYPDPVFDESTLGFYRRVASRYLASLGEVIKMALPPGIEKKSQLYVRRGSRLELGFLSEREKNLIDALGRKASVPLRSVVRSGITMANLKSLKQRGMVDLFSKTSDAKLKARLQTFIELFGKKDASELRTKSKKAREVLGILSQRKKVSLDDLRREVKGCDGAVGILEKEGFVGREVVERERNPWLDSFVQRDAAPRLYPDQKRALVALSHSLEDQKHKTFLLYGITGSGKTEVYLRAIEEVLEEGRNAIALVPEISLTPQFVKRFRARFGGVIAVLHSSMSKGERYDQWRKIFKGQVRIVIGARSAIFAPIANVGIIVVDEEHDSSYKQEDRVMYNARDLAIERGKLSSAVAVLGSATPSLESYYKALSGEYDLLTLSSRMSDWGLALVEVVDLRKEKGKLGKRGFLSDRLLEAIRENYSRGGKTILFLNRRGFSSFVLCRSCGVSIKCPDCSVSLTYHERMGKLVCHYCNYSENIYGFCKTCGAKALSRFGFGTEQVEREIKIHFPDLVVERMDRDTTTKKFSHEKIIRRLEEGEIDVLIGTQMVSKGLDIKGVTLVGVILADISLNIPDFRSCERTFSLLTQVAGRSGRGAERGRVIIQTYNPEHYSIHEAANQNFKNFYEKEISQRRDVDYPPFVKLVNLKFSSKDFGELSSNMKRVKRVAMGKINSNETYKSSIQVLGPCPAPLERLKGEHRWQMIIKCSDEVFLASYVKELSDGLRKDLKKSKDFSWRIDRDPQSFM